jgi:hypothetical protein
MFGNVLKVPPHSHIILTPLRKLGGWQKQYRAASVIVKSVESIEIKQLEVQDVSASPRF